MRRPRLVIQWSSQRHCRHVSHTHRARQSARWSVISDDRSFDLGVLTVWQVLRIWYTHTHRLHTTAGGPPSRPLRTHPSIHPSIHPWFSIPCWLVICRVAVTMSCVRYSRVCRSAVRWALWFRLRSWQTMNIHMYVDWLCAGLCDSAWDRDKQWRHWCHRLSAVNHPVRWSGCYDRSVCARHRPYVTLSPSHYCYMSHSFNVCVDWFTL